MLTDTQQTALRTLQPYMSTAQYPVDADGLPETEPARTVLLAAITQQAEFAEAIADPTGARAAVGNATIGTLTLNGAQTSTPGNPAATHLAAVSPHALALLKTYGLLASQNEVRAS